MDIVALLCLQISGCSNRNYVIVRKLEPYLEKESRHYYILNYIDYFTFWPLKGTVATAKKESVNMSHM